MSVGEWIWFLFSEKKILEGHLPSPCTPEVTSMVVCPNNITRIVQISQNYPPYISTRTNANAESPGCFCDRYSH
jgi:hypothetical protein